MGSLTNLMTESLALYDRAAIDMPNRKIVPFRSQISEWNICIMRIKRTQSYALSDLIAFSFR